MITMNPPPPQARYLRLKSCYTPQLIHTHVRFCVWLFEMQPENKAGAGAKLHINEYEH